MKEKKKSLILLITACMIALLLGLVTMLGGAGAAGAASENLAIDASAWQTYATNNEGAVTIDTDGITLKKWNYETHPTAVALKTPIQEKARITIRFRGNLNFTQEELNSGVVGRNLFGVKLLKSGSLITENFQYFKNVTASGTESLLTEFEVPSEGSLWAYLCHQEEGKYTTGDYISTTELVRQYADGVQESEKFYIADPLFDGTEQTLVIQTDFVNGVMQYSVFVNGQIFTDGAVVDAQALTKQSDLSGPYYLAFGAYNNWQIADPDWQADESQYVTITDVQIEQGSYDVQFPDDGEYENIAVDPARWSGYAGDGGVLTNNANGDGLRFSAWPTTNDPVAANFVNCVAPASKLAIDFKADLNFYDEDQITEGNHGNYDFEKNAVMIAFANATDRALGQRGVRYWSGADVGEKFLVLSIAKQHYWYNGSIGYSNVVEFSLITAGDDSTGGHASSVRLSDSFADVYLDGVTNNRVVIETSPAGDRANIRIRINNTVFFDGTVDLTLQDWSFGIGAGANIHLTQREANDRNFVQIDSVRVDNEIVIQRKTPAEEKYADPAKNLATNPYNFDYNAQNIAISQDGMLIRNIPSGASNLYVLKQQKVSEFDFAMKFNADLRIDWDSQTESERNPAAGYFCNLMLTFKIDSDEPTVGKQEPRYYGIELGRNQLAMGPTSLSYAAITTFKGYSTSDYLKQWQVYNPSLPNISDGNDHWLEVEFDDIEEGGQKGITIKVYLDDAEILTFTDYDGTVTEQVGSSSVEYEKKVHGLPGYIGLYSMSDASLAEAVQSSVLIKEMYVISYDETETGEFFTQMEEPLYSLSINENFAPAQAYYVGEDVVLNLESAFNNAGKYPLTFTVLNNATSEAIGTVDGSIWTYVPTVEEYFVIRVTATPDKEGVEAKSLLIDINILEDANNSEPPPENGDTDEETGGCARSPGGGLLPAAVLAAGAAVGLIGKKKKI